MTRFFLFAILAVSYAQAHAQAQSSALWDEAKPFPKLAEIAPAKGVEHVLVNALTPEWKFLHEPRIGWHKDTLFVTFSHSPIKESELAQEIHGRRSTDGGRTWSAMEVIAPSDPVIGRTETACMLSHQDRFLAFVGRYGDGPSYSKNSLGMEVHELDAKTDRFHQISKGLVLENFVPFVLPQRLANGNWIISGHMDKVTHAAVAISAGDDLTRWHTVKLETPQPAEYPETSLITQGKDVVAIIRQSREPELKEGRLVALTATSHDSGETFDAVHPSNLPMQNSKPFSGTLSNGQHYAIFNAAEGPRRNTLLIAVTKPGELLPFRQVYKIIEGTPEPLRTKLSELNETAEIHEWAYPEATEKDGILYITYSQDKRHAWLARVPVTSLQP